jgi:DNA processing protein
MEKERMTVGMDDKEYPDALRYVDSPPNPLYYSGDLSVLGRPCVAVVGSRKASDYGKWAAYNLSRKLSDRGVVVVSGMAEGIDSFAHKGALDGESPTVAVLGNGIDICFPRYNDALQKRIEGNGLLLSEYEDGVHGTRYTFPARNRIISGLCVATVIVEAGLSSGSLITAGHASSQGREVYAIPGNINRSLSVGCNKLIRDGATPLVFFDDILDDLGLRPRPQVALRGRGAGSVPEGLGGDEALVLGAVCDNGGVSVDDAVRLTGLAVASVVSVVTLLEMKGYVYYDCGRIVPANV